MIDDDFNNYELKIARLKRKLDKRDQKIAGLRRELATISREMAIQATRISGIPVDVKRAVQDALCNVRMIPVRGMISSDEKIVEVRTVSAKEDK